MLCDCKIAKARIDLEIGDQSKHSNGESSETKTIPTKDQPLYQTTTLISSFFLEKTLDFSMEAKIHRRVSGKVSARCSELNVDAVKLRVKYTRISNIYYRIEFLFLLVNDFKKSCRRST